MTDRSQPGMVRIMAVVLGLFVAGTPLIAWLWETLNQLLSGRFEPLQLLISVPVFMLFWLLLRLTARLVTEWTGGTSRAGATARTGEAES